jgi:hypothetical protein
VGVESLFGTVNNLIGTQGILLSIDMDVFDIGAIDEGEFYVKFILCSKYDCFKWALTIVYGSTQNDKEAFLTELVQMASHETLPILIGGDFNILRGQNESAKGTLNNAVLFYSMQLLATLI